MVLENELSSAGIYDKVRKTIFLLSVFTCIIFFNFSDFILFYCSKNTDIDVNDHPFRIDNSLPRVGSSG